MTVYEEHSIYSYSPTNYVLVPPQVLSHFLNLAAIPIVIKAAIPAHKHVNV